MSQLEKAKTKYVPVVKKVSLFVYRVLVHFIKNKGFLLAGAVGYNALISIVPLCLVILTILSKVLDVRRIASIVSTELRFFFYDQSDTVKSTITNFADNNAFIGGIGFVFLIFFSSIAFRMLEDAMSVIFRHLESSAQTRHPVTSMIIAFFFITAIGLAIFFLTVFSAILNTYTGEQYEILGHFLFSPSVSVHAILRIGGFLGTAGLLTSFYRIMPTIHVRWRLAAISGFGAAALWEIVRTFLEWYFANISMVNVIYGSLGTVILILVSFEVAASIVLIGAQAIADLELNAKEGIPWWEAPEKSHSISLEIKAIQRRHNEHSTRSIRAINEPTEDMPTNSK